MPDFDMYFYWIRWFEMSVTADVSRIHIEANSNKSTREIIRKYVNTASGLGEEVQWNEEEAHSRWGGSSHFMFWLQNRGYAPSFHLYNLRSKFTYQHMPSKNIYFNGARGYKVPEIIQTGWKIKKCAVGAKILRCRRWNLSNLQKFIILSSNSNQSQERRN